MFCILLANLRKQVKILYNLQSVNEDFEDERNAEAALLDNFNHQSQSIETPY